MLVLILLSYRQVSVPHAKSLLLAACLVLAWFWPRLGDRFFTSIERLISTLATRTHLVMFGIAVAVILLRISLLGIIPVPIPTIPDEFGYLLSADTFAHGRLTNPPHPLWHFFDTFHVNPLPTYQSRYPPAQGFVMAFGQLLGHPWIGVLLSVGVMCAALLWALQAWLPPAWALLGAGLVALRIGTFNYWTDSYYGGAVAAIGGALVIGALPRILRNQRPRDAWLMGIGTAILANSRPVEGFIFCLPVAVFLVVWLLRRTSPSLRVTIPRVVLPILVCLLATCAFMAYYNWRVTGDPSLPPFVLNQRMYFRGQPVFIWQKKAPPIHTSNPVFDAYFNAFPGGFDGSLHGLMIVTWKKFVKFRDFFLFTETALLVPFLALPWLLRKGKSWPPITAALVCAAIMGLVTWQAPHYTLAMVSTLPMIGVLWLLRDDDVRFLVIELIVAFVGLLMVIAFIEHYAAPLTAVFFVLLMQSIRYLRGWQHRGRPVGIGLSRVVILFVVGTFPVLIAQAIRNPDLVPPVTPQWSRARARIEAQLEHTPGQHLVIVRYSPQHPFEEEVVYNLADIDHSKVVWARENPGTDMRPLLSYFPTRQVWLLQPDISAQLTPYSVPQTEPSN